MLSKFTNKRPSTEPRAPAFEPMNIAMTARIEAGHIQKRAAPNFSLRLVSHQAAQGAGDELQRIGPG